MTVGLLGGLVSRKWKYQPEISAARISCLTSGSFRPKFGLFILSIVLLSCCAIIIIPFVTPNKVSSRQSKNLKMEINNREAVSAVAKANSDFTKKLYSELMKQNSDSDNLVVSPFSISSVLAMTLAGARGKTEEELRQGLSLPADDLLLPGYKEALATLVSNENFTLDTANQLYVQTGFQLLTSYLENVQTNYLAEAVNTNFAESEAARSLINTWVEKKTNDKIKDLIKSGVLNHATRLVLVNAVYFKGDWAKKFKVESTKKAEFHLANGSTVETDMMSMKSSFRIAQVPEVDGTALELPYKGDRLSMIFILPDESLAKTESSLQSLDLSAGFKFRPKTEVIVSIPKFKIESSHDLNDPLKALGMSSMFDQGTADFSQMTDTSLLYMSSVVQKAFIEVNEEGSEAAAATAGIMMMRAMPITPEFVCNKPFLYLIKDNLTGFVLFAGRVANPTK